MFGIKTQLQFGKLALTTVFTQQKSQSKQIEISNGAQQSEFRVSGSDYEANKHYFLAQYFRDQYNRALKTAPVVRTGINITKIEVWVTNKTGNTTDSRDVIGFMDLGEYAPYNPSFTRTRPTDSLPSAFSNTTFPTHSNNLLATIPTDARLSSSPSLSTFLQVRALQITMQKLPIVENLPIENLRYTHS